MANQHSIVRRQQPYIKPYDLQSIEKTMAVKEGRYNANTAIVNQAISQFSGIDLAREEDKAMLYDNLKKVLSIVDNTDDIDFSKTGAGSQLATEISKAVTPEILKQASNTKAIRDYTANIEEIKKGKNPENFNQRNDYDARMQSGYFSYMNGETDNLGNMSYTNYVDVSKEIFEQVKELKDVYPDREVEVMDPASGRVIKKSVSSLTPPEWERFIGNSFNDHHLAQLEINGRAAYNYNNEAAVADIESRKSQIEATYDDNITKLKAERVSANDVEKARIDAEITQANKAKTAEISRLSRYTTAGQIGSLITRTAMTQDIAASLSREFLISKKVDYQYLNAQAKLLEAQGGSLNPDGTQSGVYTKAVGVNIDPNLDPLSDFEAKQIGTLEGMRAVLKESYDEIKNKKNELTNNTFGEDIDALEQQIIKEFNQTEGRPPSELELHRLVVDGAAKWLGPEMSLKLGKSITEADMYSKSAAEAEVKTVNAIIDNNRSELYEQTFNEESQMAMFTADGNKTTYGAYLRKQGITNESSFNSWLSGGSKEAEAYKANLMLQSASLDTQALRALSKVGSKIESGASFTPGLINSILGEVSKADKQRLEYARKILGDENFGNILMQTAVLGRAGDVGFVDRAIPVFGAIRSALTPDQTIENQSTLSQLTDDDDFDEEYGRQLKLSSASIPGMNQIIVAPEIVKGAITNKLYKEISEFVGSEVDLDTKNSLNIQKAPDGTYSILQGETFYIGDKRTPEVRYKGLMTGISPTDIRPDNLPEMYKLTKDQENKEKINFALDKNLKKDNLFYYGTTANEREGLMNVFGGNNLMIQMASKGEAEKLIIKSVQKSVETIQDSQMYWSMLDSSMKQSDKFSVAVDRSKGGNVKNVVVKIKDKKNKGQYLDVMSFPINTIDEEFEKIIHAAPQIFLTETLRMVGLEFGDFQNGKTMKLISENLD